MKSSTWVRRLIRWDNKQIWIDQVLLGKFGAFKYLAIRLSALVLLFTLLLIPVLFALTAFAESLGYVRTDVHLADILLEQNTKRVLADPWIPFVTALVFVCCIEAPRVMPGIRHWRTLPLGANQLCIRLLAVVSGKLAILILLPACAVLAAREIDVAVELLFACLGTAGWGLVAMSIVWKLGTRAYWAFWVVPGILIGLQWNTPDLLAGLWRTAGPAMGMAGLLIAWILIRIIVVHSSRFDRYAETLKV